MLVNFKRTQAFCLSTRKCTELVADREVFAELIQEIDVRSRNSEICAEFHRNFTNFLSSVNYQTVCVDRAKLFNWH